uniref:UPAR/Ly6 domain-containing protein n=1 Tax=Junco hyemalis TaxID=40217 RepID=A0A8C5IGN7_JUNHY
MKFSLLAVLALVLFAAQANSLYCYTCNWEQSNWSCLKAEKCSDKDEYCVTNVASVGIGRITKKCSSTCPHHNFLLGLATYTSYCCQSFLCNLSAVCPSSSLALDSGIILC